MKAYEKQIVLQATTIAINSAGVELKAVGTGETYNMKDYACCYTVHHGKPHKSVIFQKQGKPAYIKIGNELHYMASFKKVIK